MQHLFDSVLHDVGTWLILAQPTDTLHMCHDSNTLQLCTHYTQLSTYELPT